MLIPVPISQILHFLEQTAPRAFALPGDPIGLQVGAIDTQVSRIAVALDPDMRSAQAALNHECQLLMTHHPLIYRPLQSVVSIDPVGSVVHFLCQHQIAHIAAHTNWDCAPGGVNDALASALELTNTRPFGFGAEVPQFKLVTFVPLEHLDAVIDAMAMVGAGEIGLYRRCAFYHEGYGTYEPQSGAEPFMGTIGERETATEARLEMVVSGHQLEEARAALLATHPYEEVAYDVYPLQDAKCYSMGRVGLLPYPMDAEALRDYIAERLGSPYTRFYGDPERVVQSLAVLGGSGGDYLRQAKAAQADAYLTGEVRHHHTWEADAWDIALYDAGHAETEMPGVRALAECLRENFAPAGITVIDV
ncbi:MAG: Nif3-like dinuclear metal center hexameric protein [Fimbriimonadia bacterium]|nr:Nif3-like dinuclear metal center hexameric protein [Fimbriimonadia bacterium]